MDPITLLIVVGVLAILIILGTIIAVIRILRQPASGAPRPAVVNGLDALSEETGALPPTPMETIPMTDSGDFDVYLAEQREKLSEFELRDLSNSFKGVTQEGQRSGVVLHNADSDTGLVVFTSQAFNPQSGIVSAETAYGKMELVITQGRAGVKWQDNPLGVLDYTNQRIMGPEGQLLGSLERPPAGREAEQYPIGFFGHKAADLTTQINALSTLRWFGNEGSEQMPAFQNLVEDLEDNQILLLLAALMLEIGFMDLLD